MAITNIYKSAVERSDIDKIYKGTTLLYESGPQLDTPTNLAVDGTTVEFDEVTNAESYEIFADGVTIGEYTPN